MEFAEMEKLQMAIRANKMPVLVCNLLEVWNNIPTIYLLNLILQLPIPPSRDDQQCIRWHSNESNCEAQNALDEGIKLLILRIQIVGTSLAKKLVNIDIFI
jgi:hypothetical protein